MSDSYLLLNGLRFHYRYWPGEGQPLVLLHGLASNAQIWNLVAPQLAPQFRVYALDQRSHGLTDTATEGFDFASIVRDARAFVAGLSLERPILVGHSWGAHTVLHYAATHGVGPFAPAGVVLVDGGVGTMSNIVDMTWEKAEQLLRPPDLDGMPREEFLNRMHDWMGEWFSEENAAIVLASFGVREDDTIYRRLPIPYHMQIARAIYDHDAVALLGRVRCPVLLCPAVAPPPHDERALEYLRFKRASVAQAEAAAAHIRTIWFENTVHDIPLHRPERLATTLRDFASQLV